MADTKVADLTGLGKGLAKLIEVLAQGIGRITKAHFERKDSDTRALEIEKLAEAEANSIRLLSQAVKDGQESLGAIEYNKGGLTIKSAAAIPAFEQLSLNDRVLQRNRHQQAKRELNINAVTSRAAEQLVQQTDVSDAAIDDDWITRFFRIIEDVSNEEMQMLWSKVLTGEIKQPKTYSLRTLELLRN